MREARIVLDLERFDPDESESTLVAAEHFARYRSAAPLAKGRRVLDAGCGVGYGLALLSDAGAKSATGIDVDPSAVDVASQRAPDAEVVAADIHELPFEDGSFDLVVCFEVIEHVVEQAAALRELRRVLASDGHLVLSSPNRDVYPPGNPHHQHEYVPDELETELLANFESVTLYRQHAWLASAVLSEAAAAGGTNELPVELASPLDRGAETYTIAIAGTSPLPVLRENVALVEPFELGWWQNQVATLEQERDLAIAELAEQQRLLELASASEQELRMQLGMVNAKLLDLEREGAELVELRRRFEEVRQDRDVLDQELAGRRAEIERNRQVMSDVYASVSWRITRPLRAVKSLLRR